VEEKDMRLREIKLLSVFIIGLFIGTGVIPISSEYNLIGTLNSDSPEDELDQSNPGFGGWWAQLISNNEGRAQSFTPTKEILTRVFLYLHIYYREGYNPEDFDTTVTVCIRDNLKGENLASAFVNTKNFIDFNTPHQDYYVEFDFPDIHVTPGQILYIVCDSWGNETFKVGWYLDTSANRYEYGSAWYFRFGEYWEKMENWDFRFATYGRNNNPPNQPVCEYDSFNDNLIITAIDIDGDLVRYGVSWDNNETIDQWTSYVDSGTEQHINCLGRKGTVGVVAEDVYGAQSDWVLAYSKINIYHTLMKESYTPFSKIFTSNKLFINYPNLFDLMRVNSENILHF
jgi:hypothetical protein